MVAADLNRALMSRLAVVGHAATKITAAMGLGGPRTHPSEQASSTAEAVRDDHTPGASHRLKTANLETLADPVELKHKLESYPLDEDAKREVVGAIQARNYLYAGLGPKEKASDKAMQMLDDSRRFYSDVPNQGVKDAVKQDVVKSAGHSNDKIAKPSKPQGNASFTSYLRHSPGHCCQSC